MRTRGSRRRARVQLSQRTPSSYHNPRTLQAPSNSPINRLPYSPASGWQSLSLPFGHRNLDLARCLKFKPAARRRLPRNQESTAPARPTNALGERRGRMYPAPSAAPTGLIRVLALAYFQRMSTSRSVSLCLARHRVGAPLLISKAHLPGSFRSSGFSVRISCFSIHALQ
jgi:hypothetical protein